MYRPVTNLAFIGDFDDLGAWPPVNDGRAFSSELASGTLQEAHRGTVEGRKIVSLSTYRDFSQEGGGEIDRLTNLAPTLDAGTSAQLNTIRSLGEGWDGYGSPPIDISTLDQMTTDLKVLQSFDLPYPPDVIPGGDGSLQAEWHLRNIELSYRINSDLHRYTWVKVRDSGREFEYFEPHAYEALLKWAPKLA